MSWNTFYLIIALVALIMGIMNLKKQPFLCVGGIIWFLVVLFYFYVGDIYNIRLIKGIPVLGTLLHYAGLPLFLILAMAKK